MKNKEMHSRVVRQRI